MNQVCQEETDEKKNRDLEEGLLRNRHSKHGPPEKEGVRGSMGPAGFLLPWTSKTSHMLVYMENADDFKFHWCTQASCLGR